ncbi:hypothetical protein BFP70_00325 [Thioclava sp. SK-1]|uniref:OmpA family protein n=1 Tax=Thioclava sp. SK-1 TaxID=1889770 RepID=UPI0008261A01|nr:OmpA family protein [Thioclava sp. SK-1]OCX66649.1 hypothetical protein BFP70_00325 [Thioclava sp. SK-1]
MRNLRNSTALALGLAALAPTLTTAQTAAQVETGARAQGGEQVSLADCIAAARATGQEEADAAAQCQADLTDAMPDAAMPAQGNVAASSDAAQAQSGADVQMETGQTPPVADAKTQTPPAPEASPESVADGAPADADPAPVAQMSDAQAAAAAIAAQAESTETPQAAAAPEAAPAQDEASKDPVGAAAETAADGAAITDPTVAAEADAATDTQAPAAAGMTADTDARKAAGANTTDTQSAQADQTAPAQGARADQTGADQTADAPASSSQADATQQAAAEPQAPTPEQEAAQERLQQALEADADIEAGGAVENAALADNAQADMENATEEVVTEDTARSSAEDFQNGVSQAAAPQAQAQAQAQAKDKDDGLSDAAKIAIAGLGALAVGAVLNNGSSVAVNSGDRVVVQQPDGTYRVIKDDGALLRQPGSTVRTQTYDDGSSRTVSTRADGAQIVTVYDNQKRIVKRTRIEENGDQYILVDDSQTYEPVVVDDLPRADVNATQTSTNEDALRAALARQADTNRSFSLAQVRQISQVRALAPAVSVETVTFNSGSAAILPAQAEELASLGGAIRERITQNPRELFLVEGHTDAVGNAAYNLALSDRRAESLALALTEYFNVPAENLVVQGYGEEYLKIATQSAEEQNRRATVRRITDLLQVANAN